eukprot:GHVL01000993.1.p1 GENE.GHVL01000993.1~~GHVL01000993.1.p1  ORF type:complete len:147 (-),score=16.04 GHVL01000993.1:7-447(-)
MINIIYIYIYVYIYRYRGFTVRDKLRETGRNTGCIGQRSHRVFKGKGMYGHYGPLPCNLNCKVFRYESTRNLLYLIGVVPGHNSQPFKIYDGRGKMEAKNIKGGVFPTHPTFIPEDGKEYPTTVQMDPPIEDPFLYPEMPFYDTHK